MAFSKIDSIIIIIVFTSLMIQIKVSFCGVISDETFQLSSGINFGSIPQSSPTTIKRPPSHTHPRLNESWTRIKDIWDYDHQELWPQSCSGPHQSPVNLINLCIQSPLVSSQTIYDPALKLKLVNYDQILPANSLRISNNGHTIQVVLRHSSKTSSWVPKVSGSACNFDTYQFRQLHFHWHQNDLDGSEHAIHGQRGAVEMHLVHFNTKYGRFGNAAKHTDGLLVLSVLFKATSDSIPSRMLQPVVNELSHVKKYNSSSLINRQLRLRSFLPRNINSYYKYVGSLTTPPCSETVTWIIFATMKDMSLDQLEMFDNLDSKENQFMFNTNRHLQPLNDRFVYLSSLDHCKTSKNYDYYYF